MNDTNITANYTTILRCVNDWWDRDGNAPYDDADSFLAMCEAVFAEAPDLREDADGRWLLRSTGELVLEPWVSVGDEVEAGQRGTEDWDLGKVVAIQGNVVTVAWEGSETRTTQDAELLRRR